MPDIILQRLLLMVHWLGGGHGANDPMDIVSVCVCSKPRREVFVTPIIQMLVNSEIRKLVNSPGVPWLR